MLEHQRQPRGDEHTGYHGESADVEELAEAHSNAHRVHFLRDELAEHAKQHNRHAIVQHGLAEHAHVQVRLDAQCTEDSQRGHRVDGGDERTVGEGFNQR